MSANLYIDADYANRAAHSVGAKYGLKRAKLDYIELLADVKRRYDLVEARVFVSVDEAGRNNSGMTRFFRLLEGVGFTVHKKDAKTHAERGMKSVAPMVIASIVEDCWSDDSIDVVLLLSGNSDFAPIVTVLGKNDIDVCVLAFTGGLSRALQKAASTVGILTSHDLYKAKRTR